MLDEEILAVKLDAWLAALAAAESLTPEELCRDCPGLLTELARRIAVMRRFEDLRDSGATATAEQYSAGNDTSDAPDPKGASVHTAPERIAAPVIGADFGGFHIVALLGKGGMGRVYRATDPTLRRDIALKIMNPEIAARSDSRERFLREARAMAAVHHDHVTPIYQVGEVNGVPFLAMPLLKGESLDARMKREKVLPSADVLRIGREAAGGLAAVHACGLVHRDLKPTNIWLETLPDESETGLACWRVKLLDFGLAREQSEIEAMTQIGIVLGSPPYMSPEQADGRPLDPRSDLFSLGSVLYECATGRRSFQGKSLTAVLAAVASHHPTPAHEVNTDVPKELSVLIARLQAKSPADRPASAQAVIETIRSPESGQPSTLEYSEGLPGAPIQPHEVRTAKYRPPRGSRKRGCAITITLTFSLLAACVIAAGLAAVGRWHDGVAEQQPIAPNDPLPDEPGAPDPIPRQPRRDFPLGVEMLGSTSAPGGVHRLAPGQRMAFRVEVGVDAYVGLWSVARDQTVTQLFPNEYEPNNRFRANESRTLPNRDYLIEATASMQTEWVWVVASTEPWETPQGRREGPFLVFETPEERENWERQLLGLKLKPADKGSRAALAEEVFAYRVSPRAASRPK